MVPSLKPQPYQEGLERLNLFMLEKMRREDDVIIQVLNFQNKFSNVDQAKFIEH